MNLYWLQARFLNPDRTVRSDRKTLELSTSTACLRWRTVSYEKSMDLYGLRFDHTVLWTVIGSHGSNGCLVSSLKMASFHLFFFFPVQRHLEHMHWTKFNPETMKPSPHSWALCLYLTLSITSLVFASLPHHRRSSAQIVAHSLNHSLPLSLVAVAAHSLPRRRHSYSIASLPRLQSTLSVLILLSFMSIYIFCPIFEGNQVYFSNKNNNQEREKKNPIHVSCAL